MAIEKIQEKTPRFDSEEPHCFNKMKFGSSWSFSWSASGWLEQMEVEQFKAISLSYDDDLIYGDRKL